MGQLAHSERAGSIAVTPAADWRRRLLVWGSSTFLALLCAWVAVRYRQFDVDDMFIAYRIAENIAQGEGWVYNLGDRLNGATPVLWTLLLTLGAWAGAPAAAVAHVGAAVALFVAGLFLWLMLRDLMGPAAAMLSTVLVITHWLILQAWALETQLYLALAVLAWWVSQRDRPLLLGALLGALTLTRPDGVLLAGILWAYRWWVRGRIPWSSVLVTAGLLLPWLFFSVWYFGSPIPNTLAAKMAQARSGFWNLNSPWPFSLLPLFMQGVFFWFSKIYNWLLLGLIAVFVIGGFADRKFWTLPAALIVAWGTLHVLAYSALNVPHYHWYYVPVVLVFGIVVGFGTSRLQAVWTGRGRLWVASLVWLVAIFVLLTNFVHLYLGTRTLPGPREAAYAQVGRWLAVNTSPDTVVAAAEIGVIGYYSRRRMVDMAGLADAEGPSYLSRGQVDWWLRRRPDVVVVHDPLWKLEEAVAEHREYENWCEFFGAGYGRLILLRRRP